MRHGEHAVKFGPIIVTVGSMQSDVPWCLQHPACCCADVGGLQEQRMVAAQS